MKPGHVAIHLTNRCAGRCEPCGIWHKYRDAPIREMEIHGWMQIASQLGAWMAPGTIHIAGGEPLLSDALVPIVEAIAKTGARPSLVTDGSRLGEDLTRKLSDSGLDAVIVSIDGFRFTNERLRGPGSFDSALMALERFYRLAPKVFRRSGSVINAQNLDELPDLAEYLARCRGVQGVFFQALAAPLADELNLNWHMENRFFPRDPFKLRHFFERLKMLAQERIPVENPPDQIERFQRYFARPELFVEKRCPMFSVGLTVGPSGAVKLCPHLPPIGNARTTNPEELWRSDLARDMRLWMAQCTYNCHVMINCRGKV